MIDLVLSARGQFVERTTEYVAHPFSSSAIKFKDGSLELYVGEAFVTEERNGEFFIQSYIQYPRLMLPKLKQRCRTTVVYRGNDQSRYTLSNPEGIEALAEYSKKVIDKIRTVGIASIPCLYLPVTKALRTYSEWQYKMCIYNAELRYYDDDSSGLIKIPKEMASQTEVVIKIYDN